MIPIQLKNLKFCRIKKGTKKPFEKDWTNKPYSYDEMSKFTDENYGVLCGYENLAVIDCDVDGMQTAIENMFPETYKVKTTKGFHNYFFIPELKQKIILETENGTHLGEVQSHGTQVVGPNSIHPSGKKYEEVNTKPIAKISCEILFDTLKGFMKETKETEEAVEYERKESSEIDELSVASIWGTSGLKKHNNEYYGEHPIHGSDGGMNFWINPLKNMWHCFRCNSGGGVLSAIAVKEGIINCSEARKGALRGNKAFECIKIAKEKYGLREKEIEEDNSEIYDDADLLNYESKPQEWLIENQIPKGEVGLMVGKRGERKTFTALYQALCLGSGKDCLKDKIPEPKKILIIDEETGKNTMAQRIKIMKKGLGLKEALQIKYISFLGLKLNKKETTQYLKFTEIVRNFKPDLIIVDCLQRCVTFEVDKDNAAISELFTDTVRPIIKVYGTTWLFIHHLRKSPPNKYNPDDYLDEVRGGSELVNYARFVLMCQIPRGVQKTNEGSELMVFRTLKMSNAQILEPKVVSFTNNDSDSLKIAYEGIPEEVLAGEVQAANKIKEWLFNKQISEFKTSDIINSQEEIGFKKNLLNDGLKILWNNGFLEKIKRGSWKITGDINQQEL